MENQVLYTNHPQNEEETEINLMSLVYAVLHRYRQIAATMVVVAILMAIFGVVRGWQKQVAIAEAEANGEPVPRSSDEQQYEEDMVEYRDAKTKHDTDVQNYKAQLLANERSQTNTQFQIDTAQEYIDESVLNSIDPYNVHTARADFYVITDYQIMPGMTYQNPDYTDDVLSAYTRLLTNSETMSAVAEQFGMEERYLRELVGVGSDSATRLLAISVKADTDERASAILDAMLIQFDGLYDTIVSTVGNHTVSLLSRSASTTVSTDLRDAQQATTDNMTALQNQLQTLKDQHDLLSQNIETADADLAALEVPEEPDGSSIVKYGVLGAVLGAMLACCVAIVRFLSGGRAYAARDLESAVNLPILGVLAGDATCAAKGFDARLNRMERKPDPAANDDMTSLIAATIRGRCSDAKTVLVTGDLNAEKLSALAEALAASDALRNAAVTPAASILTTAATVSKALTADAIILAVDCTTSRTENVKLQREKLEGLGKTILGCVVYE